MEQLTMRKYVLVFSVSYFVWVVVLAVIAEQLKFKAFTGLGIPIFFAICNAASIFSKDHARDSTFQEKKSFAWQAVLSFWVVSLAVSLLFIFFLPHLGWAAPIIDLATNPISTFQGFLLLAVAIFSSTIFFFALPWIFAWCAKLSLMTTKLWR